MAGAFFHRLYLPGLLVQCPTVNMEDFIVTVEEQHLVELLEVAINDRGAFRRFKDVLVRYPEEREKWFQFKDERMQERALEWLDDIGVTIA